MVQVTLELMARSSTGYNKKRYEESLEQFAKRVTHLYLEAKNIDDVGEDLPLCKNLTVLYLYDNELPSVPELQSNSNLTHLYLQNNRIRTIERLHYLPRLTKLYLGGNDITVVEGLETLENLTELHVEHQRLPPGEKLLFDPRSLLMLGRCLQTLNIAGNRVDDLVQFECLSELQQVDCSDNEVAEFAELTVCLRTWRRLQRLQLNGNPVSLRKKFRERVIAMSDTLTELDGKEVSEASRNFLKRMQDAKERRRDSTNPSSAGNSDMTGQSRQMSETAGHLLPGLPSKHFDSVLQRSETQLPRRTQSDKKSAGSGAPLRLIAM